MDKNKPISEEVQPAEVKQTVIGDFHTILTEGKVWRTGGFTLPDGSFWAYREPEAVVIVRNGYLYVRAQLSRQNDHVQILDNAKHMYYSAQPVEVPEEGRSASSCRSVPVRRGQRRVICMTAMFR